MTDQDVALLRVMATIGIRPAGLVTDIDGTISRITAPPEAATVVPAARRALQELTQVLDLVAVVSGRSAPDARRMVDVPGVVCVGNHGLEWLVGDRLRVVPAAQAYVPIVADVTRQVAAHLDVPGTQVENKGVTASFHYREASDPVEAEKAIRALVDPLAAQHDLAVRPGRMVVELRPRLGLNKGTAIRDLVERYDLRSIVFLGDDTTDLDAFAMVRELREAGAINGLLVGAVGPDSPPEITSQADITVGGVDGAVDLIVALATRLGP